MEQTLDKITATLIEAARPVLELSPDLTWSLATELARGAVLLLILALAVRAAVGVRARYRLIGAGLLLALVLPLASATLGVWKIELPAGWATPAAPPPLGSSVEPRAGALEVPVPTDHVVRGLTTPGPIATTVGADRPAMPERLALVSPAHEPGATARHSVAVESTPAAIETAMEPSTGLLERLNTWGASVGAFAEKASGHPATWLGLWALGVLAVLGWGGLSLARLAFIAATSIPADDRWVLESARVTRRLGIRRPVRVVISPDVAVPMTWGVLRPVVVIPPEGTSWDAERRRVVLTHELVHVRRFDWALQIAAWGVLALHWCNPLAWWAVRRLSVERERSCDAAVVAAGTRPSTYAAHLLEIARALTASRSPVHALGMAKTSELEGRLMSILNEPRVGMRRSLAAAALVACAGLATAAVAVAPVAHTTPVPPEQLEELDRREAELAALEAELDAKRAALARKRAELKEAEARERAEAAETEPEVILIDEEGRPVRIRSTRPTAVSGSLGRGVVLVADEATPAPRARVTGASPASSPASEPARAATIGRTGPTPPTPQTAGEPEQVIITRSGPGAGQSVYVVNGGTARVWDLGDEETLAAIERAEVIVDRDFIETQKRVKELHDRLSVHREKVDAVRTELEPHRERLARIAERVRVPREVIERVQTKLEPEQAALEELHEQLEAVHRERDVRVRVAEAERASMQARRLQLDAERAVLVAERAQIVAKLAGEGADEGESERWRSRANELARKAEELAAQSERMAVEADRFQEKMDRVYAERESGAEAIHKKIEQIHERMGAIHAETDALHEHKDAAHAEMEAVHRDMEHVHSKMEAQHQKMEDVHHELEDSHRAVEKVVSRVVASRVRKALESEGVRDADRISKLAASRQGSSAMVHRDEAGELVRFADAKMAFHAMREAIDRALAEGELSLTEADRGALDEALRAAAEACEIMRFKVVED